MIFTIGDSLSWGQGLIEQHKFDVIFARSKATQLKRGAHSAATIGTRTDSSAEIETGEIPIASPSLWQQVLAQGDWSQFELVLVNGGINDVSLTRILSPWTRIAQLEQWIDQFCNQAMQGLLVERCRLPARSAEGLPHGRHHRRRSGGALLTVNLNRQPGFGDNGTASCASLQR